jgi:hypothetical protein
MPLVLADRVRETTTVSGTNDAILLGAVTGFQAFSVIGNTNTTYYTISDQAGGNWEVGIGTFNSVGPTLARTTVLSSSAGGTKVSFPAGTKDIFLTYPSEKSVYLDASDNVSPLGTVASATWQATVIDEVYGGTGQNSYTTGDILYSQSTNNLTKLGIGTNGQVLTSTGTAPQWSDASGVSVTTFAGGTTGLTPATATSGAVTLAGTLVAANGGTGQSSYTAGDLLYATGSTALSKLGIGTNGQALLVSGGTLAWGAVSGTTGSNLTIAKTGGAVAPATFNGSAAVTIDYSTVGADQEGTAVALAIALG